MPTLNLRGLGFAFCTSPCQIRNLLVLLVVGDLSPPLHGLLVSPKVCFPTTLTVQYHVVGLLYSRVTFSQLPTTRAKLCCDRDSLGHRRKGGAFSTSNPSALS